MRKLFTTLLLGLLCTFAYAQNPNPSWIQNSGLAIQNPGSVVTSNPVKYVTKIADVSPLSGFYVINNPLLMQTAVFQQSNDAITQYLMGIQGVQKCSFDGSGNFKIEASNAKIAAILIQHFGFTQTELNTPPTN